MKYIQTILEKVAGEHPILHNQCGGDFLKAAYDLFNSTEGVMDNECAKSFLQLFAEMNDIDWDCAVEYLYYIMKEAFPKFCTQIGVENFDWVKLCSLDPTSDMGKFMKIKGNEKYACKGLFKIFCQRANIDAEDCLKECYLDAYGWKRVINALSIYVIEEYLSVEERYENADHTTVTEALDVDAVLQTSTTQDEEATNDEPLEVATETLEETATPSVGEAMTPDCVAGKTAVKAVCIDDNTSSMFRTIGEAAKTLGMKSCSISNFKRGRKEYCRSKIDKKKYRFEFFGDNEKGNILMIDPVTKEIVMSYKKATEAAEEWGIDYDKLQGKLKCKRPESHLLGGYEWWKEADYNKQFAPAA